MEFYKARVEELREDNAILVETKNMLEDQLGASQKRVESVVDLENELIKYRQQVDEMTRVSDKRVCYSEFLTSAVLASVKIYHTSLHRIRSMLGYLNH